MERSIKQWWVPFAKGGEYSRFYSDWDLVFDWTSEGREFKRIVAAKYGSASRFVKSEEDYFKPGITWMQTTNLGMNARVLPGMGIFGVASPTLFLRDEGDRNTVLAIMNSSMFDLLARCVANRNWGATAVGSLPVPRIHGQLKEMLGSIVVTTFQTKESWDEGNELSARFAEPWLVTALRDEKDGSLSAAIDGVVLREEDADRHIRKWYSELDRAVFDAYGLSQETRETVLRDLGERPPEIVWPQMEGKTVEQKRMEHVWRLLSYVVKRIVEADDDGIVPFVPLAGEAALLDRVHRELAALFPGREASQVEAEIANELKRKVAGYKRADSIREWLENVFFAYHVSLYKNRPIFWHIASSQGGAPMAFGALVHYHKFDKNRIARLRSTYLREAMDNFRREAALADKEGRTNDRVEWQAKLEEAQDLDRRLQWVQEGHHEGPVGGNKDYRISTPWKKPHERPKGWDPDIDDGVKVNIEPLQRAGVLRVAKVV